MAERGFPIVALPIGSFGDVFDCQHDDYMPNPLYQQKMFFIILWKLKVNDLTNGYLCDEKRGGHCIDLSTAKRSTVQRMVYTYKKTQC